VEAALDIHRRHAGLQARDSLHVAVMVNNGVRRILSADQHFDAVREIQRFDPMRWAQLKAMP
jgi:predicted nucleic acid-binding protein